MSGRDPETEHVDAGGAVHVNYGYLSFEVMSKSVKELDVTSPGVAGDPKHDYSECYSCLE